MEILIALCEQHGPWVAVAAFLIWHQRKDYRAVCKRLNKVEDYCKETLSTLVQETTSALQLSAETIEKNTEVIDKWKKATKADATN